MIFVALLAQASAGSSLPARVLPPSPVQNVPAFGTNVQANAFDCKVINDHGEIVGLTISAPEFSSSDNTYTVKNFSVKSSSDANLSAEMFGRIVNLSDFDGGVVEYYVNTRNNPDLSHYSLHWTVTKHGHAPINVTKLEVAKIEAVDQSGGKRVMFRNIFYGAGYCKSNNGGM